MKNKKIIIILILILSVLNIQAQTDNIMIEGSDQYWQMFAENIECTLSSNINYVKLSSKKYPVIKITIKYNGDENVILKWDENFGRVLWEGIFLLEGKVKNKTENSSELKFQTSNTYESSKKITLKKGDIIISTLDFTQLPAKYITNIFSNKGKTKIQLHIVSGSKKIPISNELIIKVK